MRCCRVVKNCALLWLALAGAQGCCPCHPGFVVGGNWSLRVDNLPPNGGTCAGGDCQGGHAGQASAPRKSAVAVTSPPLQPVPVAPVPDPTIGPWGPPMVTPEPHAPAIPIVDEPPRAASSGASSWLFVRDAEPSASGPSLADRRRLPADVGKDARRR